MKKFFIIAFVILICLFMFSCSERTITKQGFYFDTVINITVDKKELSAAEKAFSECSKIEDIFSRTKKGSELYNINSGITSTLSEDMKKVLAFSLKLSQITQGAFDITVAPLCDLWNIKERKIPPTQNEINGALSHVGYEKISLSPFSLNGTKVDLGAIAKGYAADLIAESLRKKGVDNAIIDLGGNIQLLGEFSVGIRDPFNPDKLFATINLKDKSAVTSGAYQRYFEYNGTVYHHIIDPRTGGCADSGLSSVTVICPSSMQADSLSTAIFVLGKDGLKILDNFPGTDALLITNNGEIITTPDFEEKYSLKLLDN